ncbi:hypothetical protein AYL99_00122 [Fonsecaea erecta]|uniref:NmrA-like domain-containing protein n=1 Tax=Fonsecaea erecta TaxID=1367422 RepID=A0A178ZWF0_9EURO|nr:hypothetical protein AYL99_00122 [Fonsecaea erecta]OAP64150.1 hypothetical protein AYL99_00122 [Fonsecaea erecta]
MASSQRKEILVIGGTGAQGIPVVQTLSASEEYSVRVLTRDPSSARARSLAALPNVTLIQGTQESEADLHRVFNGVYGAWVNLDGFILGEMKELYLAFRCYEIARAEGLKHYVWANCDYALKIAGWKEEYHWGIMMQRDELAVSFGKFRLVIPAKSLPENGASGQNSCHRAGAIPGAETPHCLGKNLGAHRLNAE